MTDIPFGDLMDDLMAERRAVETAIAQATDAGDIVQLQHDLAIVLNQITDYKAEEYLDQRVGDEKQMLENIKNATCADESV
jgi:hypothetical protein